LTSRKDKTTGVAGTEFTEKAVNICEAKGIEIKKGSLNSRHYPLGSFDIITSFEVIEHIYNPNEDMSSFYSLLRRGGLLYLTTPNFDSINRIIKKQRYHIIEYPEHLCYYTKHTIKQLLSAHGFTLLKTTTTGFSFKRLRASIPHQTNTASTATSNETLRMNIEAIPSLRGLKYVVNAFLNITSLGDSLKAWAKKA